MKECNENVYFARFCLIFFGITIFAASSFCFASSDVSETKSSQSAIRSSSSKIEAPTCGPGSTIGLECVLENCLQLNNPSQSCYSAANIATHEQCKYMGGTDSDSILCSDLKPIPTLRRIFRRYIFFQCCAVPVNN